MVKTPNTSPDNIYYPDNNTAVDDLAGLFAAQATSVQTAIAALRASVSGSGGTGGTGGGTTTTITDSGWTLSALTVATGWSGISDSLGNTGATGLKGGIRKWGNLVEIRVRITRTGATLTANSQGNIGDTLCATINNTAYRPAGTVYQIFDLGPGKGLGGLRIQTDGLVYVVDAYPSATIPSGTVIQASATFLVG